MLSRRHLRIRVLLALYSFYQSDSNDIAQGEKELFKQLNKMHELFIWQLSLLTEIVAFARKRMEENKKKFFPTEEDLNPNTRFVDNRVVRWIEESREFNRFREAYKVNWADQEEMIRKLYVQIRETDDYAQYMSAPHDDFKNDREILIRVILNVIDSSEILQYFYEEKNIYWSDDFYTVNSLVIKALKAIKESWPNDHPLPPMLKKGPEGDENEDKLFMRDLFRKTIVHSDEYQQMIAAKVKNWEIDRVALMDILILKMAIAELLEFPSIPVKVTLNEYIDLAKMYSTPKSKIFVNGILDKMIGELKEAGKIKKTGRGLIEN
ncbi:MAG: transcription antitermination factor NusB [Bacteroidales bacterium]